MEGDVYKRQQLVRNNIFMFRPRHGGGYEKLGVQEIEEKYLSLIHILKVAVFSSRNILGFCVGQEDCFRLFAWLQLVTKYIGRGEQFYPCLLYTSGKPTETLEEAQRYR